MFTFASLIELVKFQRIILEGTTKQMFPLTHHLRYLSEIIANNYILKRKLDYSFRSTPCIENYIIVSNISKDVCSTITFYISKTLYYLIHVNTFQQVIVLDRFTQRVKNKS